MTATALFLSGTVGVGKTTTALAVGDLLVAAGVSHAVIDVDWLRRRWPAPPGDRFDAGLALLNLSQVAANYRDAGAERLVVAGVLETKRERRFTEEAVGLPMTVCRLELDLSVVHDRLRRRHRDDADGRRWHLQRAGELAAILDRACPEDVRLDTTGLTVAQVAEAVARLVDWP